MKTRLLLSLIAMLLCTFVTAQKRDLIRATYDTNYGKMSLVINFETRQVTGFYGGDGKILGSIDSNNRITGGWVQKEQGILEFDFTDDFKTFAGKFGVGNNLTGGVWQGTAVSVEYVTGDKNPKAIDRTGIYEAIYNTEYGTMKLTIDFDRDIITGEYGIGGKIEGKINNSNRLVGTWGRIDRGRMEFDFSADFLKFTGKWGEKDGTLTDGVWMGDCITIAKRL